ncbi:MAG: hypothetical protein AB7N76_01405 [Planctomycetota bacterium]
MTRLQLCFLALLSLPLGGCFHGGEVVDAIYEVPDDDHLVVFPSRQGSESAWTSTIGHRVSEAATRRLEAKADFLTVPYGEVIELMYVEPSKQAQGHDGQVGLDVTKITPERLAELTGAQWVVVVDIVHFQEKDPNNINMVKATASADVKLFKVAKSAGEKKKAAEESERQRRRNEARERAGLPPLGQTFEGGKWVAQKTVNASYPKDFFGQYGETFLDPVEARRGLIEELGERIAECFYEHEVQKLAGSGN